MSTKYKWLIISLVLIVSSPLIYLLFPLVIVGILIYFRKNFQVSTQKLVIFSLTIGLIVQGFWFVYIPKFSAEPQSPNVAFNSTSTISEVLGADVASSQMSTEEVTIDDPSLNSSSSSSSNSSSSKSSLSTSSTSSSQVSSSSSSQTAPLSAKVTRVIDGDTIEIEGGYKVRYIGIDTPELSTNDCYAAEATNRNSLLVMGKTVSLEKDVSETDKYGRLLRYVRVDGVFVNESLVRDGFAKATAYSPDVKYQTSFTRDQSLAQSDANGMWSACYKTSSSKSSVVSTTVSVASTSTFTAVQLDPITSSSVSTSSYTIPKYNCHSTKNCTQITECDEAYFQLNTCNNKSVDADGDGIPCESICK